jgi:serine/threonine-protein phosphatase 2A regulatory subunit A
MSVLPAPSMQMARTLNVTLEDLPAMTAFQLFQTQLDSSTEAAVDAMKRLGVVALAMGKDDATTKLLPYLVNLSSKHHDELLLILGQELPHVIELVGPKRLTDFLPLLERLAAVEETVVREQAVVVMQLVCKIAKENSGEPAPYVGVAKRLAGADWFTAKVSVCGMVAGILELSHDSSGSSVLASELLPVFKELCTDETPMVRRAAAKSFGSVMKQAGTPHKDFFTHLPPLVHDEQDSVRLLAVATLAQTGTAFGEDPTWTCQHWLPLLKDGSTDMSW